MKMIVGISGNRCVGKDSFYTMLSKLHPTTAKRYAFADALKQDLFLLIHEQFDMNIFNVSGEDKEIIRPILIGYGNAWRMVDIDHWVKISIKHIESELELDPTILPVVVDIRYKNELEYLRYKYGDDLIHIHIDRYDAIVPTFEETRNIDSVSSKADYSLEWGNNTQDEMFDMVKNIYNDIQNKSRYAPSPFS